MPDAKVDEFHPAENKTSTQASDKVPVEDPQLEKKSYRYLFIMFIVLVLIIAFLFSLRYIIPNSNPDNVATYNGFKFEEIDGLYYTAVQQYNSTNLYIVPFHFLPSEVEQIPVEGDYLAFLNMIYEHHNGTLYIVFDPDEPELGFVALSNAEFSNTIVKALELQANTRYTKKMKESDFDPITCDDDEYPVVYFKQEDTPSILVDGNCLIISGKNYTLVKSTEKVLYLWLNIIR